MTPDERARLRALADAATPGPWEFQPWSTHPLPDGDYRASILLANAAHDGEIVRELGNQDGDFVAAARTAVPALLDALDAETLRANRAEARIKAVRDLHQHVPYADVPTEGYCGTCQRGGAAGIWPCDTVRALDGEDV